jgi:hypothetical protein
MVSSLRFVDVEEGVGKAAVVEEGTATEKNLPAKEGLGKGGEVEVEE